MLYSEHHISNCYSTIFTMEGMCISDGTDVAGNLLLANPVPISFFFFFMFIWRPVSVQISLFIMCCSFQQSEQPDNISVLWSYSAKCLCAYIITFMAEKQVVSQKTLEVFDYTPAYKNRVCLHEVAVYLRLIHATIVPYSLIFFTPFIALSLYFLMYKFKHSLWCC